MKCRGAHVRLLYNQSVTGNTVQRGLLIVTLASLAAAQPPSRLERAHALYQKTDYRGAISILTQPASLDTGPALELLGRCWYQEGEFGKAVGAFEKAVAAKPANSGYRNWLGRAWGRRAETSNPLLAPRYASRARHHLEEAVRLDPLNLEAASDLLTYYLEAPGFLGGGIDKATSLAERIKTADGAEYNLALARIAERRKQVDLAEKFFLKAIDLAPKQVGNIVELAKFLARQGKFQASDAAFTRAFGISPSGNQVRFAAAETYVQTGRNLEAARRLLAEYVNSTLTPDDPPREEALKLLRQIPGG